jgi:MYXO-CTERM domain-containing protein
VLPLAEFGIGTAIALFPGRRRFLALALFPPLALSSLFVAAPADESAAERLEALRYSYPDVPENLPPGKRPYSFRSQWAADIAAAHKRPKLVEDRTILPTFYFPSWEVRCAGRAVPAFPDSDTALLSYRGSNCTQHLRWTGAEKAGALTSALALLLALGLALRRRRRRAGGLLASS